MYEVEEPILIVENRTHIYKYKTKSGVQEYIEPQFLEDYKIGYDINFHKLEGFINSDNLIDFKIINNKKYPEEIRGYLEYYYKNYTEIDFNQLSLEEMIEKLHFEEDIVKYETLSQIKDSFIKWFLGLFKS